LDVFAVTLPQAVEWRMELKEFLIIALPFPNSTLESEYTEFAVDDETALKQFEARFPLWRVKSVTEK
jgi:hypothetical protein